jgi:hypothetical protein
LTVLELIKELQTIVEVHPKAGDAHIRAVSTTENTSFIVTYISYDTKYKRNRILLED